MSVERSPREDKLRSTGVAPRGRLWSATVRVLGTLLRRRERPIGQLKRILILQLQQLGDTVVFTPTLRAIRERYPDAEIDLLAGPIACELYRKSPHANTIYRADSWGKMAQGIRWRPLIPTIRAIRARRYDCVIADATELSLKYTLMAFLTGARVSIGFDVDGAGSLHTHRLSLPPDLPLAQCNLEIARLLGASTERRPEEISFDDGDVARVAALLGAHGIGMTSRLAVIHPGSNWQSKLWDPTRFARVADSLVDRAGCAVVFIGTHGEAAEVEATRRAMRSSSVSLVGKTSLTELAALCAGAWVFVGTDSGPRNVAGAVGARTVVVMSAQEATGRWFGYRPNETVVRATARCIGCSFARCAHRLCMATITDDEVAQLALASPSPRGAKSAVTTGLVEPSVPASTYAAVAGDPDADCAALRRLALGPPTSAAWSDGPLLATHLVTDRPRVG